MSAAHAVTKALTTLEDGPQATDFELNAVFGQNVALKMCWVQCTVNTNLSRVLS